MATYLGDNNANVIVGTDGADNIRGLGGNDTIDGYGSSDTIDGGDGNDLIYATSGGGVLNGGNGNDRFYVGGNKYYSISGGGGSDKFYVVAGSSDSFANEMLSEFRIYSPTNISLSISDFEYGPDGDYLEGLVFDEGGWRDYGRMEGYTFESFSGPGATMPTVGYYVDYYSETHSNAGHIFSSVISLDPRFATEENLQGYSPIYDYVGTSASNVWFGTEIAERIKTLEGNDSIDAGGGDDTLQGGAGNDSLTGGEGSDVLWGYEDNDLLNGGAGIDDLFGNTGNDTLYGGDGDDRLDGGAGDDRIEGQAGSDTLVGGDGQDVLISASGEGPDILDGGDGSDFAEIDRSDQQTSVNVSLAGAWGPSGALLWDGTSINHIEHVSLKLGGGSDYVTTGVYYESVKVSLHTGAGSDTVLAGMSFDYIDGGDGDDVLVGEDVSTSYFPTLGNGGDTILGGSGNDTITAAIGSGSVVDGGAGTDTANLYISYLQSGVLDLSGAGDHVGPEYLIRGIENYNVRASYGVGRITLGSGDDSFDGRVFYKSSGGANSVLGGAGNDRFWGGEYGSYYDGGEGDDIFYTSVAYDNFLGGSGNDTFYATLTYDFDGGGYIDETGLYTGGSYATLNGGDGTDILVLSSSLSGKFDFEASNLQASNPYYGLSFSEFEIFNFEGSSGDDNIVGASLGDTLQGGGGRDTLLGGKGDDSLDGGVGDDRLEGQLGNDFLKGGDGNDFLTGLEGSDTMRGGAGNDQLYSFVGQGPDVIDGGEGVDYALISRTNLTTNLTLDLGLAGTQDLGDGTLVTSIEQLSYKGGSGMDRISGGTLGDDLSGNAGNDSLSGQAGNDTLDGGAGADTLLAGAGDDTIVVRGGEALSDLIDAGTGTDTLKVDGTAALMLSGFNSLVNGIEGWSGNGKAVAGTGAAERFDLSGLTSITGLLWLDAAGGNDTVIGSLVADDLRGGAGADSVAGGGGDDILTGGAGNDTLDGGAGSDTIVFSGLKSNYSLTNRTGGGYVVTDLRTGAPDGTDVVLNAEALRFSDTTQNLTAVNTAPGAVSDSNAAANQVAENASTGTLVGVTALASDPDAGDSLTYSLVNSAGGRFAINATTGVVTVANGSLLDYETATGHLIRVRATDTGGLFSEADVTINLTDVAEGNTRYTGTAGADTFTATSAASWTLSGLDGNDSLTGAGGNDTLDGGLGTDTLVGGAGNDTFLVRGAEASADSLQGGEGVTDTLKVDGTAALTLAGFDTSLNGIEVWAGNSKGVIGTGAANRFDLSGLTSVTGLPSLDAAGGNDTVIGSSSADNLLGGAGTDSLSGGAGNDTLTGGAGNDTLDGGTGSDTMVFSGLLSNYSIANRTGGGYLVTDLRTGTPDGTDVVLNAEALRFSDASVTLAASNIAPTDIALSGTQVSENATAGTLIGTLTGTDPDAGDRLTFALASPSSLFAVSGTSLVVASGAVLDYEAAPSQSVTMKVTDAAGASYTESFSISLTNQFVTTMGTSSADLLTAPPSSEEARISSLDGNDTLTGAAGNDTLDGGNGADFLVGGAGADQLVGGAGSDTAGYESATSGIGLDMADAAWAGAYGDARGDVLTGIERVNGSAYADVIRGTTLADLLNGNAGNDLLLGRDGADTLTGGDGNDTIEGGAGADNLNGQAGTDLISYASATAGVTLDLANLATRTGEAALDTIQVGFEGIVGTSFADTLSGTTGSNVLEGGAGDDVLSGRAGADTFVFRPGSGTDRITDFTAGAGVADVIEWHGQFTSFAGVQAAASDYTGTVQGSAFTGVQIQSGTDVLYLAGITKVALVADDFAFL